MNTLTQAQRTIADFLISDFSDDALERLYADAKVGDVPYSECYGCLVGHSDQGWYRSMRSRAFEANDAYRDLGYSAEQLVSDAVRINRLIPLIEAEMARRAALRAEVVAWAREVEDFPGQFKLWQANCQRSLRGKAGQAALRELEAALLALPEKRLIAGRLQDGDGQVCALGALARYKNHTMPISYDEDAWWEGEDEDGSMEDFGVELGMPRLVAWKVVELNDVQIDGHCVAAAGPSRPGRREPFAFVPFTPEERYDKVLAWVRRQIVEAI